ncbi:MAG TPA: tetratricopeptide repeat protein [Bacteroidia bacterium]|nr:tetratricopeptide repeat protein [Bacteroidia bacterium]
MKKFFTVLFFIMVIFLSKFSLISQNKEIDSLKNVLKKLPKPKGELSDTIYIKILNDLARELIYTNPDTATTLAQQCMQLSENMKWKKGKVICLKTLGSCNLVIGNYQLALNYYNSGIKIAEEISDYNFQARFLGNIGIVYYEQSDFPKALEYFLKALKFYVKIGDKNDIANLLSNIGNIYKEQTDYPKALKYYLKALKIAEELGDKRIMAINLYNIGNIYYEQSDYPQALNCYFRALKINEDLGNKRDMAINFGSIGNVYSGQADYTQALDYYFRALKINEELGNRRNMVVCLGNIGDLYRKIGDFKKSEKYLKKAIALSDSIGTLNFTKEFESYLSQLYDTLGQYKLALEHFKKYIAARDTIESDKRIKEQSQLEARFEYEMKEMKAKAEQEKKEIALKSERKRNKIIMNSLITGLILVLIFSFYIWRSLSITKSQKEIIEQAKDIIEKQKDEVEEQKRLVEIKNKDIMDSINYALRIQQAILPDDKKWNRLLTDSFKLYLPKDVLAGDFYWLEENENYIYVAAADCTGHGVPGAMVSVVCSSALTKAVLEDKLTNTNEILDRVREIVIEKMSSNEGHLRDGMDVCLVRINKNNRKEIQYSGANRSLYIIKENGVLEELSPDKQPIGWMEEASPFKAENKVIDQGDMLYLTTDGFADQFGGPKNKKIKTKGMLELFINVHSLSLSEQKEKIQLYYSEWKGGGDQTDDVCVIGIRI